MLLQEKNKISPEEYLDLERVSAIKSEYFDGEVFAMAGASREHNQISANIVRVLGNHLLEKPCSVFSSDMKVKIWQIEKYTYPDIVVVCGNEEYDDENNDILLNPIVIIEILSDSTEAYDRGDKFSHYQLIDSFSEYILVSQYFCKIEKFSRQKDETWIYSKYNNMEDIVSIESVKCELPISEIYRKVNFSQSHLKRNRLIVKKNLDKA
ncbi:MAG: Uma2 family endonuclease [Desulfobacterales bacterium]|nr:Uma2 family endonuclease [Desulfobacterales bacterium]